jgi:hypothetical protein
MFALPQSGAQQCDAGAGRRPVQGVIFVMQKGSAAMGSWLIELGLGGMVLEDSEEWCLRTVE